MLESDDEQIVRTPLEPSAGAQNSRTLLIASLIGAILLMIVIAAVTFH
jgi:preprotein translocase subunit SecD